MKNQPYLLFGGDFAPIGKISTLMSNNNFIDEEIKKEIENSILTIVNLEAPTTFQTDKINKSGPNLKLDPVVVKLAKEIGINGFFLANNHIMDYGIKGLNDTLKECKMNNVSVLGAGLNIAEASKELSLNYKGVKICIVNYAENEFGSAEDNLAGFSPLNIIKNFKQLKNLRKMNDILIVSIHGGIEHLPLPPQHLREVCNFFITEGCDAIICNHNHIASAYEYVDNKPIFYGLGNFLFDGDEKNLDWQIGFMLKIKIDEKNKKLDGFEMLPYKQSYNLGGIRYFNAIQREIFFIKQKQLNEILTDDKKYKDYLTKYYLTQELEYIILMYFPFIYRPVRILKRIPFIEKIIFNFSRKLIRLNLIRCESHYEILKFSHLK